MLVALGNLQIHLEHLAEEASWNLATAFARNGAKDLKQRLRQMQQCWTEAARESELRLPAEMVSWMPGATPKRTKGTKPEPQKHSSCKETQDINSRSVSRFHPAAHSNLKCLGG